MTEKLKYKVGDKVLIEAKVTGIDDDIEPCAVRLSSGATFDWIEVNKLEDFKIHLLSKVPQSVMDYYLKYRDRDWVFGTWFSFESMSYEVKNWLYSDKKLRLQRQHALATLIAYGPEAVEVEKEKKYRVKLKATEQYLKRYAEGIIFSGIAAYVEVEYYKHFKFTKQELIDAGFEGVFDNPMFEVEEVE